MNTISTLLLALSIIIIIPIESLADVVWGPDERLTNNPAQSSLPAVACDPSGNVHVVWQDYRDGDWEIYYKRWDGAEWTPDLRLTNNPTPSFVPAVACDPSGNVHVVWEVHGDNSEIYYKRWDGVEWTPDLRLTEVPASPHSPAIASDTSGKVHVVWFDHRHGGGNSEIYYKRWDGAEWTPDLRLTVNQAGSSYPAIASDTSGSVHVVWVDYSAGNFCEIYYKKWNGVWWTPDLRLTEVPYDSANPAVACDPTGNVHMVWVDYRDGSSGEGEIYYKNWNGAEWTPDLRLTENADDSANPAVACDPSGNVHVVWEVHGDNSEIYYKRWDGTGWTQDSFLTSSPVYAYSSVACDPSGNVHLVWQDDRDGNWEIYYKRGEQTTMGIDEQAQTSAQSKLTIGRPNPFRTSTTIAFSNVRTGRVCLSVYDSSGRLVARPFDQVIGPGKYEAPWNGRSQNGSDLPSGVYFYRLSGESNLTNRIVLAR